MERARGGSIGRFGIAAIDAHGQTHQCGISHLSLDSARQHHDAGTGSSHGACCVTRAGVGRSFQITNLFGGLSVEENMRLAVHTARRGWATAADVVNTRPVDDVLTRGR